VCIDVAATPTVSARRIAHRCRWHRTSRQHRRQRLGASDRDPNQPEPLVLAIARVRSEDREKRVLFKMSDECGPGGGQTPSSALRTGTSRLDHSANVDASAVNKNQLGLTSRFSFSQSGLGGEGPGEDIQMKEVELANGLVFKSTRTKLGMLALDAKVIR
jgi:hypothetical protein